MGLGRCETYQYFLEMILAQNPCPDPNKLKEVKCNTIQYSTIQFNKKQLYNTTEYNRFIKLSNSGLFGHNLYILIPFNNNVK